ncbi:MAG: SUF system NifU family Fe-S cluster assembly protein [Firmicutes bacterium]|nr:SUF system NifU family Fe-S cluster assembly protein [Bacillota bacterium]
MSLEELYRETILDHNQSPRNRRALAHPTQSAGLMNPTCGDQITLELEVKDGIVTDVGFDGHGCSISMASASMLTEAIRGKSVEDALAVAQHFKAFLTGIPSPVPLGDLEALKGVSQFPSRVKCATLAHNALEKALTGLQ